jgi:1-acyl-sn-glycerol-3-phosphate acyltransferase
MAKQELEVYGSLSPEYDVAIPKRTRPTDWVRTIAFALYFNTCIIFCHIPQYFIALLYPFSATRPYYEKLIQYTKLCFGRTIVAITQLFAPTTLVLTCSDEDGNVVDPETLITRDARGNLRQLRLPQKSLWISNHQVYTDWLYLWYLAYYSDLADSVFITLMKLYKWIIPIGPAMQFFRFIFLSRKWETDKNYLARQLGYLCHLASDDKGDDAARGSASKLLMLLFPEGTLVSPLTRPISKRFADKEGIEDCKNLLLPRSTGLLFSLRTLAADIKDLKLVDYTIGYPGVPAPGKAQEYYTLRSTFMQGVAPPAVHIHFTILSVNKSNANRPPVGKLPESGAQAASQESTEEEKKVFADWLLNRWRQKDEALSRFYVQGDFMEGTYLSRRGKGEEARSGEVKGEVPFVEIPVRLRSPLEFGHTIFWGLLLPLLWGLYKLYRLLF